MARTSLSSKGQVIIPKSVRERQGWRRGTVLEVEERGDGVLLRAAEGFPRTTIEEVLGCLKHKGPALTLAEMDAAVAREARRRR